MKRYQLGEFEEMVLLTVCVLQEEAYGVSIKEELEDRLNRNVSVGALQSALRRMEDKGFLDSWEGETTSQRGGRPRRYFKITLFGVKAIEYTREIRSGLWRDIPKAVLQS